MRKGFNSQAKRFTHSVNENSGPGLYLSHTSAETRSPSISKKGTCGLASKTFRVNCKPQRGSPAPNTYNLQSSPLRQHDFNRKVSRVFHPPIAPHTANTPRKSPAPNHYNVCYSGVEVNPLVSAQAAFLSKTRRCNIRPSSATGPSPCQYSVRDTALQKNPKVPLSCFKSTSARIQTTVSEGPGPASYSPYASPEPVKRTILPRGHYLGLAAPPLIPPKDPPLPGPGQYDIVSYTSHRHKHLMSSAAFMSSTRRGTHALRGHRVPAPGSYKSEVPTKHSFLYNRTNMLIPA